MSETGQPTATIIPFPGETSDRAATERLQRALATLDAALAEQRAAIAQWQGAMAQLGGTVQDLGRSLQTYHDTLTALTARP
jgi:uncharacterized coiled-coil protein SlyX